MNSFNQVIINTINNKHLTENKYNDVNHFFNILKEYILTCLDPVYAESKDQYLILSILDELFKQINPRQAFFKCRAIYYYENANYLNKLVIRKCEKEIKELIKNKKVNDYEELKQHFIKTFVKSIKSNLEDNTIHLILNEIIASTNWELCYSYFILNEDKHDITSDLMKQCYQDTSYKFKTNFSKDQDLVDYIKTIFKQSLFEEKNKDHPLTKTILCIIDNYIDKDELYNYYCKQ